MDQKKIEEINKLCKMSRIETNNEKSEELKNNLNPIKNLINQIQNVYTDDCDHYFDVMRYEKDYQIKFTKMRKDVEKKCLSIEEIEKIAPKFKNQYFVIPKAISEEIF